MEDLLVDWEQWIFVDSGMKPTGTSQDDWDKLEKGRGVQYTCSYHTLCC